MVVKEILRQVMQSTPVSCKKEFMKVLEDLAGRCKTTKLWVDMLIKPVFIVVMFIMAEREGDWLRHLEAFSLMMPYRSCSLCTAWLILPPILAIPPANVRGYFIKGEHATRTGHLEWNLE